MTYCCKEFEKQATTLMPCIGSGWLYPAELNPSAQFERDEDGTWVIYDSGGDRSAVVVGMKFCPYCGASLAAPTPKWVCKEKYHDTK